MQRTWLAPATGIAFFIVLILGFIIGGEPPDADSPVADIIAWYDDNGTSIGVAAALIGIAGILLVFFGNHLRRVYDAAARGGGGSAVGPVVLVGTAVIALGFAFDATILIALQQAADDIAPSSTQALQALWDNDFLPIALGIELFLISNAIAVLTTGALPRWLGWVAIILAIAGATPAGFAAFIGSGLWVVVAAIVLTMRERSTGASPAAAAP